MASDSTKAVYACTGVCDCLSGDPGKCQFCGREKELFERFDTDTGRVIQKVQR